MNTDDSHKRFVLATANENLSGILQNCDLINDENFDIMFPLWNEAEIILLNSDISDYDFNRINKFAKEKNIKTALKINSVNKLVEPFGELSFTELISEYDKIINKTENKNFDLFLLDDMRSITDIRAAVFACKKVEKPVYVFISINENGSTDDFEVSALGILITAQKIGANMLGINFSDDKNKAAVCDELTKYSKIPIIADNVYLKNDNIPLDDSFIFTHYKSIYFLEADTTEISEPITCQPEMEEIISDVCDKSCDILRVEINTCDDAIDFSRNAHMCTLPVMFYSENELALKMALMLYQGIALIDSDTMIPCDILDEICRKYGAVIY